MLQITQQIKDEARRELARRYFWNYCKLRYPQLYKDDRAFLKYMCERMQWFVEQNEKQFLVINLPPRHFKSLTATNFVEWLLGLSILTKVMTASYNETLSTTFASKVRDTIDQQKVKGGSDVYADIFPGTRIQQGKSSKSLWGLEGSNQDNYLATSPTGTSTGFGAHYILIDDIIKNAKEAFNPGLLEDHFKWFTDTMMSRTEGDEWKIIAIMTRWAKGDLAGQIIEEYGDLVEVIQFKAVQDDGSMLCEEVLSKRSFETKTKKMSREIVQANYNQQPIDVQGRLYDGFNTYTELPKTDDERVYNRTDTADKGADWLCSVDYKVISDSVYIINVEMSDEAMEVTEPRVAKMLNNDKVTEADIESNNGGRGFARNVERELKNLGNNKVVINDIHQSSNKEARILASSAWCRRNVIMPVGWDSKWPEFADQLLGYQRKGKNEHDDAPDVLAGIYERVANTEYPDYSWKVG